MVEAGNPVGAGLIESLARPGGNVTGLSSMMPDLGGKLVELLHQVLPSARRVAYLFNPTNPIVQQARPDVADAAQRFGLSWWWLMSARHKTSNRPSPASSSHRRKRCWLGSIP